MVHLSERWTLAVDLRVAKEVRHFPRRDQQVIKEAVRLLPHDPYFGDIQKMKGEKDVWRRRIGSYRIFYKIKTTERVILVFRAERRTSATY